MLFKKIVFVAFAFLSFANSNAQEFKLGKVSIAELQEKEHPKNPSAVAAVLFKKGEVRFEYSEEKGFVMITEVQARIKIYKKDGYGWANQKVNYYMEGLQNERVDFSDAITYNLVDGKIEKTKMKSDGEFNEKINKYWGQKKITMPNVKEGSIIEYKYKITSPRIGSMKDWDFQTSIPVNYSEFTTYVPEYYVFKPSQKGFVFPKVTVFKKRGNITINGKDRTINSMGNSNTAFYQDKIDFEETQTSYIAKDLPAMNDEVFVNNIDNYVSSVSHELSIVNFPNTPVKYYSTDWESVVKTIYDYDDFGPELNKTGYFENDINKLLVGVDVPNDRMNVILNYVKSTVKWNEYKGYSCNDGVKTAYKNKTGNTAEINLMLTAMLRFAGLQANPVLVSTRDNGIAFFPSRNAFNYVIAAVETPEGLILLDATEKYSEPNLLPIRDLNWNGRLVRKDGSSTVVDLMPKKTSRKLTNINVVLKSDGLVEGELGSQFTDHIALEFRKDNLTLNNENYLEKLEHKCNDIEINNYVRENESDLTKPMIEKFSFKGSKELEIIDGKIYLSPLLFLTVKENPFKQEVREYPVDFSYPTQERFNVSITIPDGYMVESIPQSLNIVTPEGVGGFKYSIAKTDFMVQIAIIKDINVSIVQTDFYPVLKAFYQQMIDKQNEKIVLKKI